MNHFMTGLDYLYIHGLVQDCSNYSVLAMELLQFYTEPYWWLSARLQ